MSENRSVWGETKARYMSGMIILHNQRRFNIYIYHIAGSACGQYEANPVF